jgi:hypothetical protein
LDSKSATDWKSLASWASVLLLIVTALGTVILNPMRTQMDQSAIAISRLNEQRVEEARGQLAQAEQRGRYLERVDQLEKKLDLVRRPSSMDELAGPRP